MKASPAPEFSEELEHLDLRSCVATTCMSFFLFLLLIFCLYIAPLLNVAWTGLIFCFRYLSSFHVFAFFLLSYAVSCSLFLEPCRPFGPALQFRSFLVLNSKRSMYNLLSETIGVTGCVHQPIAGALSIRLRKKRN